ncbi:MAG TPA: GNAT family N-acetyltransferase [Clostridia bacterium]|nr:GNAT family N-acetyltransferase [Clostridia bacterium]
MLIRQAKVEDAEKAAELISLAWEECACVLAGTTNGEVVQKIIKAFYQQPKNILSYENVLGAEGEQGVAGLVLSFPSDKFSYLNRPVLEKLPKLYKADLANFQKKVIPMFQTEEARPQEYYIDSLAVDSQYRACGIGSGLLKAANRKSRQLGLKRTSLIVKPGNKAALKLYKKYGYQVRGKLKLAGVNYLSMVKAV